MFQRVFFNEQNYPHFFLPNNPNKKDENRKTPNLLYQILKCLLFKSI